MSKDLGGSANSATPKAQGHQADNLREAIKKLMESFAGDAVAASKTARGFAYGSQIDDAVALFQAREQQLLTEIMGELPEKYTKDEHPVAFHNGFNEALDAVVAVIKQRMVGMGSLQSADNAQGGRT
jgi:hypothetical protein